MKLYVLLALLGVSSTLRVEGDDMNIPDDDTESMADPLASMTIPDEEPEPMNQPNSLAALAIEDDDEQESNPGECSCGAGAGACTCGAKEMSLAAKLPANCKDQAASDIRQDALPYNATNLQKELLEWQNYARTDPVGKIVPELEAMLKNFGTGCREKFYSVRGHKTLKTNEGAKAVQEAIDWIKAADRRVVAIKWDQVLTRASKDMAVAQGKTSETGHTAPDGSTMSQRIEKYGKWQTTIGENIAYGTLTGKDIVLQLFIDDGVPKRGHRDNIMNSEFKIFGAWVAGNKKKDPYSMSYNDYKTNRYVNVLNYAGGMTSNGIYKPRQNYDCISGMGAIPTAVATPKPVEKAPVADEATSIAKFTDDILEECDANKDAFLSYRELRRCVWQMYRKQATEVRAAIKADRSTMQAERKKIHQDTRAVNKKAWADTKDKAKQMWMDYRTQAKEEWNNLKDDKDHYKDLSSALWNGAKKQLKPGCSGKGINHESLTDYLTKAGGWKEIQKFHKAIE